jgi:hypothetical protein
MSLLADQMLIPKMVAYCQNQTMAMTVSAPLFLMPRKAEENQDGLELNRLTKALFIYTR